MASGKIDPMHQFTVEPIGPALKIGAFDISFTNSALFMVITLLLIWLFMLGGMKRQLVPGRWQVMVEGLTGFIQSMVDVNIGPKGKRFAPLIFSLFTFILVANFLGLVPLAVIPGMHAFTTTSQFSITGILAIMSFSIVLIVGFAKHGLHFFSLFVPHGTPLPMIPAIFLIELVSFAVRPFSLALRLFVAMMAGHVLLEVLSSFVIDGTNAGVGFAALVGLPSFLLMIGICALEILVAGIQAYVFALLTSLYINDAENLH